jgi:hypothetical protein
MRPILSRTLAALAGTLAVLAWPLASQSAEVKPAKAPIALAAPKDFDAAVRAIEAATGATATKLRDLPLADARSFAVAPDTAEALLEGSHQALKQAGVYLFRHERSFGMPGEKDQLGVMNTADWRAVVRRVGTAGPDRRPSSAEVAAWLDALWKDEPFDLREVGADYLAGRFDRAPKDPEAVAKRCAEFAPELVAGRASTLHLLVQEIATRGTLYLIW